jgi:SulP family sulfate permease
MHSDARRHRWLPSLTILGWARGYDRGAFAADALAAAIVTAMLIPQGLAYALLAGLPPEYGLYASMAPLLAYAVFGSSRVLAVGPVAVVSLMTAAAIAPYAAAGVAAQVNAALTLAMMSGLFLLVMGLLRLGALANFLSHSVISGFISASAILIAAGQLRTLLAIPAAGDNLPGLLVSLAGQWHHAHGLTLAIGAAAVAFLFWVRKSLQPMLVSRGVRPPAADMLARAGPVVAVAVAAVLAWAFGWAGQGVKVVGSIPAGLPPLTLPAFDAALWRELALPALLISIVGFVESVSVGHTLAAKRRQRIEPNQELVALGASNIAAALSSGFPVTGGFARSVVNFDAGARTPAAGALTAIGIAVVALVLTPAHYHLPQAVLAATIVVAVLSLVDVGVLRRTWSYSRTDFAAVAVTFCATLLLGVERGLVAGVAVSLAFHLYRTSRPHIAVVGLVPGTQHFRNVQRHRVAVSAHLLSIRVDESLYFANARALEDALNEEVAARPALRHVVLQCTAINTIDASALESLEASMERLHASGIALHLSEVKGPVMDRLQQTRFLGSLTGRVYLSHYDAVRDLTPEVLRDGGIEPAAMRMV